MQQGDEGALDILIKKYKALVSYIVSGAVSGSADREEAVNDTFYKVWKNRESIDPARSSLKTYISITAQSCAIDKRRSLSARQTVDIEENDIGFEVDYEHEAAKKINMQIIADCIKSMKSPDREIFIDRYYYRLSVKEISKRRGVSEKKAENILYRRKKQLAKELLSRGIIL